MNRFDPILKNINEKLDLPQPTKSRIILEIAADLDDLYNFYRTNGLSEKNACQKTEEKFDLTDEALSELVQIHQSVFRKLMDKLSEQAQTRLERIVLIIVLLSIAVISSKALLTTQLFLQASKFIMPVMGIAVIVFILSLFKFYTLYIKKDHNIKKLRAGLPSLLFFGGSSLFIGICGYFIELYLSENKFLFLGPQIMIILNSIIPDFNKTLIYIIKYFISTSSLVMFSMLVLIFTAIIWVGWNKCCAGIFCPFSRSIFSYAVNNASQ